MSRKISRRQFLKLLAATTASSSYLLYKLFTNYDFKSVAQGEGNNTFLPIVVADIPKPIPPPTGSRVVHVHSANATDWVGSNSDYWNYVNQDAINNMVDQGMMQLTGTSSLTDAWQAVLPNYRVGQGIAIKVSFNNISGCGGYSTAIDSIFEPVHAIIRGLKSRGVSESDIWIYDATRPIPDQFVENCLFNGVKFFDYDSRNGGKPACRIPVGWSSNDPNAEVLFSYPEVPTLRLPDVLINASYLINLPIMKAHGAGVSLAIKNHVGSLDKPVETHTFIGRLAPTNYDALVDIYRNPHIQAKTILTVGDGIFAAKMNYDPPTLWSTFDNQVPKSLFFATDPVAIDCVMSDFLDAEISLPDYADKYLALASDAGLGVFERGDPWSGGYSQIDYQRIEI